MVEDALYSAELNHYRDMPAVTSEWSLRRLGIEPMNADQLIQELVKRGAHQA